MRDDAEGKAILAWAERNFGIHLKDNLPRVSEGAVRLRKPGHEVALLGIAAFAIRFGATHVRIGSAIFGERHKKIA